MLFDVSMIDSVKTINHNPMKYFQTMNRWNIHILGKSFAEALGHVWNFTDLKSQASFPKQLLFISQTSSVYQSSRTQRKMNAMKKKKKNSVQIP